MSAARTTWSRRSRTGDRRRVIAMVLVGGAAGLPRAGDRPAGARGRGGRRCRQLRRGHPHRRCRAHRVQQRPGHQPAGARHRELPGRRDPDQRLVDVAAVAQVQLRVDLREPHGAPARVPRVHQRARRQLPDDREHLRAPRPASGSTTTATRRTSGSASRAWTRTARSTATPTGPSASCGPTAASSLRTTFGHGLPFVYATKTGGNATLTGTAAPTVWTNANGAIGYTINGHDYAAFGPTGLHLVRLGEHDQLVAGGRLVLLRRGAADAARAAATPTGSPRSTRTRRTRTTT